MQNIPPVTPIPPAAGLKKDADEQQNYYFRVRTILNDNGNVESALYGKIHGDFIIDPINSETMLVFFTYYLNPQSELAKC